jgi:hypothetical protein
MGLRFLLDEDTTAELAHHLSKSGHDVARVVEVEPLGPGNTDRAVMEHARSVDRIIVTHDDDYADPGLSERHRGVFYCPNQRLSPFETYRIVAEVIDQYPGREGLPPIVYLTPQWL